MSNRFIQRVQIIQPLENTGNNILCIIYTTFFLTGKKLRYCLTADIIKYQVCKFTAF